MNVCVPVHTVCVYALVFSSCHIERNNNKRGDGGYCLGRLSEEKEEEKLL